MKKLTYKTIENSFSYEIPKIKGSKFLTTLFPILTKEDIENALTQIRKEHYNATHNCYAWRFGTRANQDLFGNRVITSQQERANDDWEPSNTAGKPILSILQWNETFCILAVVTRYFWGTLLGVWGLIQAYTEATKQALTHVDYIEKEITKKLIIDYSYDQVSTVQYLFSKYEITVLAENYWAEIRQEISVNIVFFEMLKKELQEKQIIIQDDLSINP